MGRARPPDSAVLAVACLLTLCGRAACFGGGAAGGEEGGGSSAWTVHTVIATECTQYFTWQTIGLVFSLRKAGQPGPITRLMSCTPEAYAKLPEADKALADSISTHYAPSYTVHPRTGDVYAGINKPVAVVDWLSANDVREEFILVMDADMIMRRPILPQELGAAPGTAASAFFGYMEGVDNELALRHVPEVDPREDTVAGPWGRRGDQVGGFSLMHREDLRRVGPLWLKYSEDVRADPKAWNLTGDTFASEDEPPWIAEMYGYSFGCAKADVWHVTRVTTQIYPAYEIIPEHRESPPKVLHYGIYWRVNGTEYHFDKHWHEQFDALACPPWDLSTDPRESRRGLLAHPPRPSSFNTTGDELFRDLLAVEVIITLNEAFCEGHRTRCPPSEELERECGTAEALARELEAAYASLALTQHDWGEAGPQAAGPAAGQTAAEGEDRIEL